MICQFQPAGSVNREELVMAPLSASSLMKKLFLFGLLGGMAILLAASNARSQADGKQTAAGKAPGTTKRSSIVREGFTRPGNPPDVKLPNGKVRYVAWDPAANKLEVIGGT